ncbi:MAG: hypothetical protein H6Q52_606 [Deltaproteobacteria bacterium]|nr:hypothetical protein [Deltaproteobacteria bacterium]
MIKNIVSAIVVLLVLFSFANAEQSLAPNEQSDTVRIMSVEPAANGIYAVVSLEYPKSWGDDAKFMVEVNGKSMRARKISGGFSSDRNMTDLMFFPKQAGKQNITVRTMIKGRNIQSKSTFDWKQVPLIAMMGHTGDREMLMGKDKQLTVAVANIMDVRVSFNGKDIYGKLSGSDIQTRSLDPAWRQGKNILTVSANKFDGSLIVKNFTFFYPAENGILHPGETAVFYYGKEGSRSGPFYDVKIGGDALTPVSDVRTNVLSMDNDGWLVSDPMLGKEFRAQKPGSAVIRIFIKPHFLEKMKLDRELTVTVR